MGQLAQQLMACDGAAKDVSVFTSSTILVGLLAVSCELQAWGHMSPFYLNNTVLSSKVLEVEVIPLGKFEKYDVKLNLFSFHSDVILLHFNL